LVEINSGEGTSLGRYNQIENVDYAAELLATSKIEISDRNFNPVTRVISQDGEIYVSEPDEYTANPRVTPSGEKLVYERKFKDLEFAQGLFELVVSDIQASEEKSVLKESGRSYELPRISGGGQLLAYEKVREGNLNDLQRDIRKFRNAGNPISVNLEVVDMDEPEKRLEIESGFNLYWVN
jgi:Tol biopolymer transport system component